MRPTVLTVLCHVMSDTPTNACDLVSKCTFPLRSISASVLMGPGDGIHLPDSLKRTPKLTSMCSENMYFKTKPRRWLGIHHGYRGDLITRDKMNIFGIVRNIEWYCHVTRHPPPENNKHYNNGTVCLTLTELILIH